ncbi:DUF2512 family protein [Bacillus testis]|uniref:DUF2512 family protein n=1 Tax=Bacillus testis TaxID=1622072 RepID=UPI00067F6DD0|nr:DUF2512 family protein [Bacillus testis]
MNHIKALVIKFLMIAVVVGIIMTGIYDVAFGDSMWISLVLTIGAYLIGDLLIFRGTANKQQQSTRNMIATISDLILAFVIIWLMGLGLDVSLDNEDLIIASIISAVIIGLGEFFFHKYLDRNVFNTKVE